MKKKSALLIIAVASLAVSTLASAVPVSWRMTGTIAEPNDDFFFPFVLRPNEAVAFDLSFESETPCSPCDPTFSVYSNPLTSLTMTAGESVFRFPLAESSLGLANDRPSGAGPAFFFDAFQLFFSGVDPNSDIFFTGDLILQNPGLTPPVPGINDTLLSRLEPPDPSIFTNSFPLVDDNFFNFTASQDRGFNFFSGALRNSSVAPLSVPEPSIPPLLLISAVLLLLIAVSERKKVRRDA